MENRKSKIENYDRLSRWYDLLSSSSERKSRQAAVALLNVRLGEYILEIGPGTGEALIALGYAVGPSGLASGMELSSGMLRQARARIAKSRQTGSIRLICGDGLDLPFPEASFDGILMTFVLELFSDDEIPQVLAECRRVLKNNGRLTTASLEKKPGGMVRMYEWFHQHLPAIVDCRPIFGEWVLQSAGYQNIVLRDFQMWGLPVRIIRGEKL